MRRNALEMFQCFICFPSYFKAAELARRIRNEERGGRAEIILIGENIDDLLKKKNKIKLKIAR